LELLSDNALMLKVKAGDLDKLGLLFKRYGRSLFRFYYRFTRDSDQSEDLAQDVFERILKYRHTYKGDGKFITWMYHIARNVLADHVKKTKRVGFEDINNKDGKIPAFSSEEDEIQKEKDLTLMEVAISMLPDDKKELIILSKFQGLKYKEIAELLNCTENNVKIKVFRALNDLREMFNKIQATGIML
jgi:RNA polymerase sigma factor (sigma-70 family)